MEAAQALQFWFQVISMMPDARFEQREENGEWRPPRPQYSNIPTGDRSGQIWYRYHDGHTIQVEEPPDSTLATHFKTYSFYVDNNCFWIYPCNAILYKVGDGSIHRPPSSDSGTINSGDGSSDRDSNEDNNSEEDWRPMTFLWHFRGDHDTTSCAAFRTLRHTLQLQRVDQAWAPEVLPDRYHAPSEPETSTAGPGGLVGKLPILIALIAFSVTPDLVSWALSHCLKHNYVPHGLARGQGWTPRRGVVVRVLRQKDNEERSQARADDSASERLRSFEYGRFGSGNFFR